MLFNSYMSCISSGMQNLCAEQVLEAIQKALRSPSTSVDNLAILGLFAEGFSKMCREQEKSSNSSPDLWIPIIQA